MSRNSTLIDGQVTYTKRSGETVWHIGRTRGGEVLWNDGWVGARLS